MLTDHPAIPVLAVSDLDRARSFYEGTLGLPDPVAAAGGVVYRTASGGFLVYPSSYAGTNQATAISFQVPLDAFDAEIDALRSAGVEFQTFDVPEGTWADGVLTSASGRSVWFADPDGNVLNVEAEPEG
ncbi:Glyoxalase/bleomycin resistance protein/dioxygenase [Xylanimonas cellulosilytica DSM 15894]|uniref:Glyoxalase/bleomycin resistance protein/dioxygenase n=1 Tax=Xylanimonas cellulosilytica (strain DSM 15894 / JCM 12276 / CECT 5975 / KCTC 9989 / LMG 20990 / NBRC 107835 / XIL07) TaxID=446471 RepID=D1BRG2_XYLCX|nr:VOC family protein [Xylanimonas cellulosilytica]ACZ30417.1 Glyoxalase/bleomycin resistance protein/dioxygenase [Xylanimonas cellulosilytica DSM 15894]